MSIDEDSSIHKKQCYDFWTLDQKRVSPRSPRPLAGEGDEERIVAKASRIVLVHKTTSIEGHVGNCLLKQRDRFFFLMNQVRAYKMAPVHVAPCNAKGVVLIIEMISTIEIHHPIRIIGPTATRSCVKLIAIRLVIVALGSRRAPERLRIRLSRYK